MSKSKEVEVTITQEFTIGKTVKNERIQVTHRVGEVVKVAGSVADAWEKARVAKKK